jgi:tRNA pseudouridine55 synthase
MRRNDKRSVNGILLLDKPSGLTSNQALQEAKSIFNARKAGHTGSLDPLASGLLALCFGQATKLSAFLLNADKHYRFGCRLGMSTSTGDAEGEVIRTRSCPPLSREAIEVVLERFVGKTQQIPPMHSALKRGGKRLYELARQGIEVERKPREITIHSLTLLDFEDGLLRCQVHCSKGTYIRTLAEDIGEALGCGGHVQELRRTGVEPFDASQMVTMGTIRERAERGFEDLDALLLPIDAALSDWPSVAVRGDTAHYLTLGHSVLVPRSPTHGWVRLYQADDGRFLGVGEITADGRVAPRRLMGG